MSLLIDGTQVLSAAEDVSFDTVDIVVSGPFWRPNTTAYFDDFSLTAATSSDPCAQQVQSLTDQNNTLTQQNAQLTQQNTQLQTQVNDLTAQNGQLLAQLSQLQGQVGQLQSQVGQLQGQVSQLQSQLGAANQTIQTQQAQIGQLQGAIAGAVGGIQTNFRAEFHDPQFTIPGATQLNQMQSLVSAILNLNRGHKQAVYANLGGQH